MRPLIPKDHPSLTLAPHMQAAAGSFLEQLGLNYFQYLTVFRDGSFVHTNNQPKWTEFCIEYLKKKEKPAVYSHISEEYLDKNMYTFLWEPNLDPEPVQLAKEHNISNGICFVERFDDHYNLIAFASPADNHKALDTYFNNKAKLLEFIKTFQHDQSDLIKTLHANKIILEEHRRDENVEKMFQLPVRTQNIELTFKKRQSYITPQEYLCLKGIAEAKTYKEVGRLHNISPRTVESYLKRVRDRFGISFKQELIELYKFACTVL